MKAFDNKKFAKLWLQNTSKDVVTMLVGNKCDADVRDRVVSKERGSAVAAQNAIPFIETSAKVGLNIEKAFFELAGAILYMVIRFAVRIFSFIS